MCRNNCKIYWDVEQNEAITWVLKKLPCFFKFKA